MVTIQKQGTSQILFENSEESSLDQSLTSLLGTLEQPPSKLMVFSQDNIWRQHGKSLQDCLDGLGVSYDLILLEDREACKTLQAFGDSLEQMVAKGFDRSCAILAFGGGTVGDSSGYVAASFMRGIPWIYIPTTLLAIQDASVGGKVGINLAHGKNLAGAFWAPRGVLIGTRFLSTLPDREFRAGCMELIKHGILEGPELLEEIMSFPNCYQPPLETWEPVLFRGVQTKIKVVDQDFREMGLRKTLNLGHTLAHAIEKSTHYRLHHGEAVGLGLIYCTLLAEELKPTIEHSTDDTKRLPSDHDWKPIHRWILDRLPMELVQHELRCLNQLSDLLNLTRFDKKSKAGSTTWILPMRPGRIKMMDQIPFSNLERALARWARVLDVS